MPSDLEVVSGLLGILQALTDFAALLLRVLGVEVLCRLPDGQNFGYCCSGRLLHLTREVPGFRAVRTLSRSCTLHRCDWMDNKVYYVLGKAFSWLLQSCFGVESFLLTCGSC